MCGHFDGFPNRNKDDVETCWKVAEEDEEVVVVVVADGNLKFDLHLRMMSCSSSCMCMGRMSLSLEHMRLLDPLFPHTYNSMLVSHNM